MSTNVNMHAAVDNDYVTCFLSFGLLEHEWEKKKKMTSGIKTHKMSQKVVREDQACSFKHKLRENFNFSLRDDKSSLRKMHIWLLCMDVVFSNETQLSHKISIYFASHSLLKCVNESRLQEGDFSSFFNIKIHFNKRYPVFCGLLTLGSGWTDVFFHTSNSHTGPSIFYMYIHFCVWG